MAAVLLLLRSLCCVTLLLVFLLRLHVAQRGCCYCRAQPRAVQMGRKKKLLVATVIDVFILLPFLLLGCHLLCSAGHKHSC